MEGLEWIFDGIGTELISLVIGAAFGGAAGYKIGSKNKIKQNQKAGDNSKQVQIGSVNEYGDKQTKSKRR
jgi:hypothetical protein